MRPRLILAALALAVTAAGCGGGGGPTGTVSGSVTYNGVPVEEGSIQFSPKSGKGTVAGGLIIAGKYTVSKVPLGPMTVFVSAGGNGPGAGGGPVSTADLAREADQRKAAGKAAKPPQPVVPLDALGNNSTFEVKEGDNTLDLPLAPPKK